MRNHGNPIEALVLKDDRLMFVSRAESMQKFLNTEIAAMFRRVPGAGTSELNLLCRRFASNKFL